MRRVFGPLAATLTAIFTLAGPMATMAASAPDSCVPTKSASFKSNCCASQCCIANAPQPPTPGALSSAVGQPAATPSAIHFAAVSDFTRPWLGSAPLTVFARSPGRTLSLLQTYLL